MLALHGCVWEAEAQELMSAACDACVCPAWGKDRGVSVSGSVVQGGSGLQVGCVRRAAL